MAVAKRSLGEICEAAAANLEGENFSFTVSASSSQTGPTEGLVLKAAESVYNDPWLRWVKVKVNRLNLRRKALA